MQWLTERGMEADDLPTAFCSFEEALAQDVDSLVEVVGDIQSGRLTA